MSIKDEDLVIDEVDNTEEDSIEISDESIETEPESEPATIQDEVDGDDEEEEDRVVTIGDSEPEGETEETEETKETPGWVKKVRKVNRKLESENKKLKRQIEANAKAVETEKPIELGEKPTLKGSGYDDAKFAEEIIAYDNRKRKVEAQAAEKAKMVEEQNAQWQKRQEKYSDLKQEHSFKDFSEAEELVVETFSQTQQSIIIQGAEDSALLVYALGKNPKKLEELSKITNPVDFAFSLAKVESQLNVKSKKAPKPEKRLNTGKAGGQSGNSDSTLDRLREEAARTGDYTKVTAYKRKLRKG